MRVILVHGYNASPEENFYPWLSKELRDKGFEVIVPRLSLIKGEELDLPRVIEEMEQQVGLLTNNDIVLGHSLGGLIILQYLEAVEMEGAPHSVILVASPWKVKSWEMRRLFIDELDADVLMWKSRDYIVVHSKDDSLVPFDHAEKLAKVLKAKLIATEGDDHYMKEEYPVFLDTVIESANTPFEYTPGMSLEDDYANIAISDRFAPQTERPEWMT
jgi:uncharacterized protein